MESENVKKIKAMLVNMSWEEVSAVNSHAYNLAKMKRAAKAMIARSQFRSGDPVRFIGNRRDAAFDAVILEVKLKKATIEDTFSKKRWIVHLTSIVPR